MSAPPLRVDRPALGAVELASVARGIVVLDQMVKRAETTVLRAATHSPGRYLILITGAEAEVEEAMAAALATAGEDRVDHLILYDPAEALRAALASELEVALGESLAIVETTTLSAALLAADRAVKESEVSLLELRLGAGLSGKGVFTLTGSLPMIEAAQAVIIARIPESSLVRVEVIAQPHPDLPRRLLEAEKPWVRGPKER
ncbi:MAG: BMC domain-containing protein [Deltaproteobacteria bacterium]|nr:BMC domain-containing protein [Deltaproteobacteria bacterium]